MITIKEVLRNFIRGSDTSVREELEKLIMKMENENKIIQKKNKVR